MGISHYRNRWTVFIAVSFFLTVCLFFTNGSRGRSATRHTPHDNVKLTPDVLLDASQSPAPTLPGAFPAPSYLPGLIDDPTRQFTRTLVVARTSEEDVGWVAARLGEEAQLEIAIYTVDDNSSSNALPGNKGHEVMVYLTHIIDHYDRLSDVTMFMHSHQITWHNNDLLDSDAAKMVKHLSAARVIREGYMNMRCHLDPGCPAHIRPLTDDEDINVPEAVIIGRAWKELFPDQLVPDVISQPCCAQLALSRDRIRALPKEQYIFFRDWLLASDLEDRLTGRIFEYVWQYIWTGDYEFCPKENICYCDGYGICFGGEKEYASFFALRKEAHDLQMKIDDYHDHPDSYDHPDDEKDSFGWGLAEEAVKLDRKMAGLRNAAFERGKDPRNRAHEAGRPWKKGDGY